MSNKTNQGKLACLSDYAKCVLSAVKNSFTKTSKIKASKLALATLLLGVLGINAFAQQGNIAWEENVEKKFSCKTLYGVSDYGLGTAVPFDKSLYRSYEIYSENVFYAQNKPAYGFSTAAPAYYTDGDTLAVGYLGGLSEDGTPKGPLVSYSWHYGNAATIYMNAVTEGDSVATQHYITGAGAFASVGGEVQQETGNIIFMGPLNGYIRATQFSYYDPISKTILKTISGLTPEIPGEANYPYIRSDMALDGDGNIYVLSNIDSIIKVDVAKGTYKKILTLKNWPAGAGGDIFGTAFLNGKFFMARGTGIYSADLMSGIITLVGKTQRQMFDLATCQTASVIKGKVFYDAEGTGVAPSGSGVENAKVEIFKDENGVISFKGVMQTPADGSYEFVTDSDDATYYIRVKQPAKGSINLAQTWAGADNTKKNIVSAFCADANNNTVEHFSSTQCIGARIAGVDQTDFTSDFKSSAQFYSKVVMKTSLEVPEVNFAFTDAQNKASLYQEAAHVLTPEPTLFLGTDVTVGVSVSNNDVLVDIESDGNYVNLNNQVLVAGETYKFKTQANGLAREHAFLNAWTNWDTTGNKTTYVSSLLNSTKPDSSGLIEFNMTIPDAITSVTPGNKTSSLRFRLSTFPNIDATSTNGPAQDSAFANTIPWTIDGEVVDYQVLVKVIGPADISKSTIIANPTDLMAGLTSNITVILKDALGSELVKKQNNVTIYIANGNATLSGNNTNGEIVVANYLSGANYTANLTSSVANAVVVGFGVEAINSTNSATVTFTVGAYSDSNSNITADPLTLAVSNTSLITVTLKDSNGNLIDGSSVTITNTAGPAGGVLDPVTPIGANSGNYTANFTTTKAGNYTFSYSVDGTSSTKNVTVEFIAGTPDINGTDPNSSTSIVVNPSTSGVDTNESVTVTITDKYGNPINNLSDVKIYIVSGTGALSGAVQEVTAVNAGNGSYTTTLTSSVANIVTVGFKLGAAVSSLNANGTFTVGAYSDSNSNITADPLTLAVSNTSLITVTLKDSNGNLIDGSSVTITNTAGPAGGVLDPVTPIGANSGNYTANFTTTKAGNYTFSYSVNGTSSTKNVTVEFIAGTPDINGTDANSSTSIVVNPSTSGVDTNESVTVTITDKYGNPINNLSDVKIYIISGTGALSGAVQEVLAINEGNGSYTTTLTSSVANIVTVGFKLGAAVSSLNATGTFTVGAYSDSNSNITADPLLLAVSNRSLITVTLKDANGNLIDGSSVTITNTAGPAGGVLDPVTPIGANSGNYTANFTTTKAGNYTFTYSVDGTSSTKNVTIEFIAGTPDINGTDANSSTSIVVNPSTSGVDTNESVTVTITDKYGNPINNLSDVKIYIVSGTGALSGAVQEVTAVNAGNGSYTTTLTSSVANIVTVGFKLGAAVSSLNATGTFTVGAYSDSNSNITADPLTLAVSNRSLITVTLKDSNGNLIDGSSVTITNTAGPAGGVLDPVTPIGANSGNYTANFTTTKAGNYTFSYSVNGTSSTKNVTVEFIAGTPDINGTDANSSTSIVVNPSTSGVDTNESVTVTITDKYGNPISDLSDVKIYIISGTGALSGAVQEVLAINEGNGSYTTNLTSSVANIVTVGFKLGADSSSLNANGTFTVGAYSDSNSNITADPLTLAVSNTSLITVTLKDSNGNLIDGSSVTITNTAGPAGGVLDPVTPIGANSGNYTANFTTTKAGNYTFSYSVDGTSSTKNVTVEFIAGTPDINGTDANSSTSIVVNPSTSGVDTNESVTVTITDKYGNPINNLSDVKIYIISGTGALSGAVQEVLAINEGNGSYTTNLTSSVANIVTVGFKLGAAVSSLNANGTFTVGAYSDSNSNITADPLTLAVSNTSLITVTLKDSNGNLIDGKTVTIIKTAGPAGGVLDPVTPIGANSGNYTANFTTTKAGNYTFSYSVDGTSSTKNVTVEFIAGTPDINGTDANSSTSIVVNPSTSGVDTNESVTVTITDKYGNPISDLSDVKIYIISGTGALSGAVQEVLAINEGNGSYTTNLTSSVANIVTVGFKLGADSSSLNANGTFTVGAYSDSNSNITADPLTLAVSNTSLITVTLKDSNGNLIDGSSVTITNTAGPAGGVLDPVTPIGANSGNYTANFTTTKAGNYTFSYSVDGTSSTKNVTVEFIAGTPDINGTDANSSTSIVVNPSTSGVDTNESVTVTITDKYGNPINNLSDVKIYIVSGTGALSGAVQEVTAVNAGNGSYTTTLTSSVANIVTVGFKLGAAVSSLNANGTFTVGAYSDSNSNITADPLTLAVSNTSLITVTLKDSNGNLIDGSSVTITNTAGPAGGVLDPVTPIGANSGNYTANFTTTKAGNYTFSYSVNGTSSTKNVTVEFIAGTPDINGTDANSSTSIVVNPSTSGVDTNESVTVTITDKYGNPINNLSDVKIYIISGTGALSGAVQEVLAINEGNGSYTTTLTSSVANIVTVGFKLGAAVSSLNATGTFTVGAYSDSNSNITADPLLLAVSNRSLITVTLKDANGNLIDGSSVTITNTAGPAGGVLDPVTPIGANSGNYTANFTTTKAGNYTFSYSVDGTSSTKNVTVEFIAGTPDINGTDANSSTSIVVNPSTSGVDTNESVTVTITDKYGNPINNLSDVKIYIVSGTGALSGAVQEVTAVNAGNGSYTTTLTSSVANIVTVGFKLGAAVSSLNATGTFTVGAYSDSNSNITADPLTLAVSNTSLITVTLKDSNGNLIDGKTVTIIKTAGANDGTLGAITPIGANSGNYTANFTTTKAGNYTFTYSVDGTSSTKNVTIEFIAGTPDINGTDANSSTSIVVYPSTSGVDTNQSVTVTITDKYGNPINNLNDVKIYIISGTGALSGAVQEVTAVNAGNGSYTTTLTSSVANIVTVGFKLGAAVSSLNATGTFTVGAYSDSNSNITADPLLLAVSNRSLITVTLKDSNGNLIDGSSVTITNTAGPAGGVLDPVTPIGANSGNYTATFTTTKAGNYTFSYNDNNNGGASSTNNVTVEFIAGTPDINGTDANSSTSIVVNPSTSGVDTNESVTVTITDKYGNPINNLNDVKIYIISGTGALSGAVQEVTAVNAGNGSYTTTLTSSVANIVTVGFKLGAAVSSLNATGTFTVGAYSDSNSNITADPLLLAVSNTSLITVTLKDSNGNLIDGSSVTITNTAGPAGGVLDPVTPIGANSGNYTANFTTTKAGNYTFSYSVDGTSSTKNVTVEFIAGTPDINGTDANSSTSIVVNPSTSGVDTNESVTVTITDKYGNPINNLSDVKIYIISGTGALSGAVQEVLAINEGNGSYTTTLTSSVANIVTVGFKLGAAVSSLNATGTFTVGAYSDSNSNITADPLLLAVSNRSLITVTLKDANGNLIDGSSVTITNTAGPAGGVLDPVTPIGANSGNYTANFTTTKAGNYTFSYSVDGTSSTKNVTVEFIAGTPDINGTDPNSSTSIVVNPSTSGVDTNESVTVTITDKYGNPINNLSDVKIYIVSGTGALSGAVQEVTAVNAGNGSYTTTLTSSVANIVTVGFKLGAAVSSLNANGTFTVGAYSDSNSNITADPLLLAVSNRSLITVTLKDANGNLIDGSSVTIMKTAGANDGTLGAITPIGANSGNYTANFTTTKAGNYTFTYSVDGTSSTKNVTIEFIAGTPDINGTDANSSTSIVVNPSTSGVDTNQSVTVTITDKYGNPINNLSDVKIYIISGTGALSGAVQEVTAVNAGNGSYTTTLTSSVANIVTVGFKLGAAVSSLNATGTFTVGAYSDSNSNITADPLTLAVSNRSLITVTLKDSNGNLIDGKTVTIIKTAGANDGTLGAITPIGANSGNYTANFTTTKAGNYTFSYSVDGTSSTKNVTVEFIAGTPDINGTDANSSTSIVVNPSTSGVDTNESVTVTITDKYGNPINNLSDVKIYIVSGTGALSGAVQEVTAVNAGNGSYTTTLTSSVANIVTVGFKLGAAVSSLNATGTFTVGAYSDSNSNITADPLTLAVSNRSLITVTLKDSNGNLIDGSSVTITNTAGPAGGVLDPVTPIGANSGNYTANFTTTKAGNYTFSYSVDGTSSTKNVTVEFIAGTPDINGTDANSSTSIVVNPSTSGVDTNESVTVTITDKYGNPINNLNDVKIYIISGTGALSGAVQEVTAVNAGNGSYTTTLTSSVANIVTVGFKLGAAVSSLNATGTFTVGAYSDSNSNITADPLTLAVSNRSLITVTLKDSNGNLIDGSSVTITNTAGPAGGVLDPVTPIGANSGNYTANFTTTKAGNYTFSYSVDGTSSTKNVTVEFIAGTPDINGTDANSSTSIVVNPSTSGVDTNQSVTVTITDKYGNPINNLSDVKIYIVSGTGALSGAVQEVSAVNAGNGSYTTTLTSSVANIVTVGFKLGAAVSSLNATGTFTVGAYSDSNSNITADPLTLAVSNTSLITVTLKDANGNLIDGKTVTIMKTAGANDGTLGAITPIGANSGNYTANFTTTKAGNYTFTYSVDGTSSTKNVTVEFIAGNASANSSIIKSTAINGTETANFAIGESGYILVTLYDQNGNIITNANTVNIIIQSGVGTLSENMTSSNTSVVADYFGNGNYRVNIYSDTPGDINITFDVGGVISSKSIIVTYGDTGSDIYVELVSLSKKAKTGDIVRFQALVENRGNSTVSNFTLSNIIPAGFSYVDSSAYILDNSGADITKDLNVTWNSPLKINDINLAPHEKITAMYFLRVGGAVKAGKHVVTAASYNNPQLSKKLSNTASADVEISTNDPMLDESLIFGTVFHDRNGNGAQDKGEEGLPGVKIATAGGYIVTTDQYGRYHLLNILGGEWSRGRNFIMKVDKASLPRGTKFTTSNPQTRRITPGIPVRYDFGVQILGDANKTETLVEQGGQK